MLELVLKHVGFGWVIVAKIGQFDARSAIGTLGRRGCVFEVTRGLRGSYIYVEYGGKTVLQLKLRVWSYTFYRFVVGLTIVGLIELLSCVEVLKNVMGVIGAVLVLYFSFEGKEILLMCYWKLWKWIGTL